MNDKIRSTRDSCLPICLGAPDGRWRITNVRRMIDLSLCTIPPGDYLPLGSYKLPNDLLLFLAEGLRQHSTMPPISLQKFSSWDRRGSSAVNDCKRVARTQGEFSLAEIVPRTKYGAFEYSIFNIFYYYSNDLFFHFKMPLKRRNSLFWNLKICVQFKFVFKEIN